MNGAEALAKADALVSEWTNQVKNERGYVHDKWSPVDLETRTEAVLRLADWLISQEPIAWPKAEENPCPALLCPSCLQPKAEPATIVCEASGSHEPWDPRDHDSPGV